MAGYSFPYKVSSAYSAPGTDDWSKTSYSSSDHVCRPVIIDAEGRKRPIVSYGPQQSSDFYVTRTETHVKEYGFSPIVSDHKHTSHTSPDTPEGYGVVEERWQMPVHNRPQKVEDFLTKVQTEASKPRSSTSSPGNWHQTTKPAGYGSEYNDFNHQDWQKPYGNSYRNDKHDDYFSNQSSTMEPSMVTNGGWGRPNHTTWDGSSPKATYPRPISDTTTVARYFNEPVKPSHNTASPFRYTEPAYTETIDRRESNPTEPVILTQGGWLRPSHSTWSSPPDSNLSKPTNDINTAIGILKEAVKPSFTHAPNSKPTNDSSGTALGILKEVVKPSVSPALNNSRYTEPRYTETIDSTEAARRYKFNFPSRPYPKEDTYTTSIDSKEAARKYQGTTI